MWHGVVLPELVPHTRPLPEPRICTPSGRTSRSIPPPLPPSPAVRALVSRSTPTVPRNHQGARAARCLHYSPSLRGHRRNRRT
ncbi:hypothetical protein CCUS01_13741 [Colletotrichum cuscutae]|uniref:Uncharacterized protein n=1 Tax=Colletotrichum cuscutae TaxID=1209917 RepID=A0AAI9YBE6_9PEZI|nr:hypothetical protein CCUS01_13741 [Colletotrichum cuscutae]